MAQSIASALLHSIWQVAMLALAAALALRAMASARAVWRHNVAMAFLVAMALAPAVQALRFWQQPADGGILTALALPLLGGAADGLVRSSTQAAAALSLLWLAGVGVMLVRHLAGLRAISMAEKGAHAALPEHWLRRVDALRAAMGIARAVTVRLSDEVLTPWTARLMRPVIWLPLSLLTRAPAEQIEALLAHELAHIARKDWLWNGLQCAVESLLFYHPAVWWLGRRIRQEREHACDDLAVAACGDPIALAEALAALERGRWTSSKLILAANGGSLMQRVKRLLSGPPSRRRWGALIGLGALTASGVLALTQLGMAGGRFPDLMVRASTDGPLGPGDYREISAGDRQRFYRVSVDAAGKRTEVYQEAGEAKPIDASTRAWIDEHSKPIVIPPPPAIPRIEDMPAFAGLVTQLGSNADVVARLGTPVARTAKEVSGTIRLDDADGYADIRIELSGPKGVATVAVVAGMQARAWSLQSVAVQ